MPPESRFSILLPPGWVRVPVNESADAKFEDLINGVVAAAPAERKRELRAMLEAAVRQMLVTARAQRATDFIISLSAMQGLPIPASISASLLELPDAGTLTSQEQLLRFATGSARAVELDGLVAMRRVRDDRGNAETPPHRTISYVCHLPWSDEWLLLTASIITTDEPGYSDVLEALEALMDAMISTVRFPKARASA